VKHKGRKPSWTLEQRQEVIRRVGAGESRRGVAGRVFGDEGLKGRVDRIITEERIGGRRADLERLLRSVAQEAESPKEPDDDTVPTLEQLFPHYARGLKRRLEDANERVTAGELETFARLEFRIEQRRMVERLNALTRCPKPDDEDDC